MYKKTVLKNGIRVAAHFMRERESVALGIWAKVGGRYEDDQIKGSAHYLEHILFKGSKKYSCNHIKEQIEGVGGTLNAFTSEELTCYYAKIPSKHIIRTFDILSDMVFHPLLAKKDVDKERGVILEEIKMYQDLPQFLVVDHLEKMLWPDHPLGKNLAGTQESVSNISFQNLRDFYKSHYTPRNIVVSACGNIYHKKFETLVQRKLTKGAKGKENCFLKAQDSQASPRVNFFRKKIEQMHLALGMIGLDSAHKDRYVLGLLNVILGGNMSSRLFNEVREKRGLAYSIGSSVKMLKDTGAFVIRAGVDNRKIVKAVDVILKELEKIKKNGVPQGEFNRAKDYFIGQTTLGLEDTMEHMIWIGESIISHNRFRTLKEVMEGVHKITPGDIRRIARQILNEAKYNLAIVGPITGTQEKELCRLLGVKS